MVISRRSAILMGGVRVNWSMKDLDDMVKAGTLRGYKVIADENKLHQMLEGEKKGRGGDKAKRGKYGNAKVEYDGRMFDSIKECERYKVLRLKERMGLISDLKIQVRFELIKPIREVIIGKRGVPLKKTKTIQKATAYFADATYVEDGVLVVEDTKSEATRMKESYLIKKKLMREVHGIEIKEV